MKRCEFLDLGRPLEDKPSLKKEDDPALPAFTTDVPSSSTSQIVSRDGLVETAYTWNSLYSDSPFLRVRTTVLRSGEDLSRLLRLRVRDGTDTIAVRADHSIFLLRKTTLDVARALLSVAAKIADHTEALIGYLQTLAGSVYSIAKLSCGLWTFDSNLWANPGAFQPVDLARLDPHQKQRLCELIQDKLLAFHSQNLVLRTFTVHNILMSVRQLLLTDLRDLRSARKRSMLVDDFCAVMRYLVTAGVASRGDVYQALAHYSVAMEPACREWYQERKGEAARDSLALVAQMEQELY